MKALKIFFVAVYALSWCFSFGQSGQIRKADKLYEDNRYAEAIKFYEEIIKDNPDKSVMIKLANCYRLTNKMDKAEVLYGEIVKGERVPDRQLYYYGEALMSNGKYDEARKYFLEYARLVPNDTMGIYMANNCLEVQSILPVFPEAVVEPFSWNTDADENSPVLFGEGLVFSSDRKTGRVNILKSKSGWTGRDYVNIYFSELVPGEGYGSPRLFSKKLSALNKNNSTATFPKTGKEVFFTRNSFEVNKKNEYAMQLFTAVSPDGKQWQDVELLSFCSKEYNFMHPAITPDGKTLFFVSDKPRGHGGTDIYVSHKVGKTWKRPENLGPVINTASNEGFPLAYSNEKLFFCSKGHTGYGGFDVFYTEQDVAGNWTRPVNVGKPINSPADDISIFITPDGQGGFFTSSRSGGDDDIYLFRVDQNVDQIIAGIPTMPSQDKTLENRLVEEQFGAPANDNTNTYIPSKPDTKSREEDGRQSEKPVIGSPLTKEEKTAEPLADEKVPAIEETDTIDVPVVAEDLAAGAANEKEVEMPLPSIPPEKSKLEVTPAEVVKEAKKLGDEKDLVQEKEKTQGSNKIPPKLDVASASNEELPPSKTGELVANDKIMTIEDHHAANETDDVTRMMIFEETLVKVRKEPREKAPKNPSIISDESMLVMEEKDPSVYWSETTGPQPAPSESTNDGRLPEKKNEYPVSDITSGQPFTIFVPSSSLTFSSNIFEEIRTRYTGAPNDAGKIFKFTGAIFGPNEYQIYPALGKQLDYLAEIMKQMPSIDIEIRGHTESLGDDEANLEISRIRAEAVKNYLFEKGISPDRMSTVGFGETRILNKCINDVPCAPAEHQFNQRLEIRVLKF